MAMGRGLIRGTAALHCGEAAGRAYSDGYAIGQYF